jgi:hypothetical protein
VTAPRTEAGMIAFGLLLVVDKRKAALGMEHSSLVSVGDVERWVSRRVPKPGKFRSTGNLLACVAVLTRVSSGRVLIDCGLRMR